jgi:transcriptional regulator with XRE-family HTH domain
MSSERLDAVSIGSKIRSIRRERRLSQIALAREAGISVVTLNRYEKGHRNPSAVVLSKIATVLNCDYQWGIGNKEDITGAEGGRPSQTNAPDERLLDPIMQEIVKLLENDLPELKEQILNILQGSKQIKTGFHTIGINRYNK